jgi:hypothetical protein
VDAPSAVSIHESGPDIAPGKVARLHTVDGSVFVRIMSAPLPGGRVRIDWCGVPRLVRVSALQPCTMVNGCALPMGRVR